MLYPGFRHYRTKTFRRRWQLSFASTGSCIGINALDSLHSDHRQHIRSHSPRVPATAVCALALQDDTLLRDLERRASATKHSTVRIAAPLSSTLSKTGLMIVRPAALRIDMNTDGRPLPTEKRWRTSSKLCACHSAPHLLTASWALHFQLPVTLCSEWP